MQRLLIANRGEIARRVIRTARRMGIETVAVYSDADQHAPHVREADHAVHIGASPARESYLDQGKVLAAAASSGADAIHPGYGFLSENAAFAEAVIAAGLIWVGPPPSAITAMGLKDAAKRLMADAGVPTTPGYLGEDQSTERLQQEADRIGYPILIKAVAGGGGKGMRKVERGEDFAPALASCRREAAASFGDDKVLLEVYVQRPRHIEVQVFADAWGNVVHMYERDCSLQRRHQKVIEEAPAPGMDAATRAAITGAAIKAARAVNYQGAGTIEFIAEGGGADGSGPLNADRIWFMEMNTRLQVEHPVTEMITGLDLVEWQLRIARGEPLPLAQDAIPLNGHAMEARLYAENPTSGFLPSTGPLDHFRAPEDLARIDSGVVGGGEITPYYDPMIAKIIVHATTREAAARALEIACGRVEVWPVKTNAGFLVRCAAHPDFVAGRIDTRFIDERLDVLTATPDASPSVLQLAAQLVSKDAEAEGSPQSRSPWSPGGGAFGFRLNASPIAMTYLALGGATMRIETDPKASPPGHGYTRTADGMVLFDRGEAYSFTTPDHGSDGAVSASSGDLISPMPGRIVSVGAEVGTPVVKGQAIVTLEAMKMEHSLTAPFTGTLAALNAKPGDQVAEGVTLARIDA